MNKISDFYFNHRKLVKLISGLLVLLIVSSIISISFFRKQKSIDIKELNTYKTEIKLPENTDKKMNSEPGWQLVGQTPTYELYYQQKDMLVKVVDIVSGEYYTNYFESNKYGKNLTEINERNIKQLFSLSYSDFDIFEGFTTNNASNVENNPELVDNGVKISFDFKDLKIQLKMYIWIDESGLNVAIPNNTIKEEKIGITKIDMLPFLGSVNLADRGYYIYPDGCGALYDFNTQTEVRQTALIRNTYGVFKNDINEMMTNDSNGIMNVALPYFGGVVNSKGFIGYVLEGDSDATVNLSTYGFAYDLSRIYTSHIYRKSYNITNSDGEVATFVEKNRVRNNFIVKYIFDPKDSSYSKLANKLRTFMLDNKMIGKGKTDTNLDIEIIAGAVEKSSFFERYIPVTTLKQSADIARTLGGKIKNIDFNISGWQTNGMDSYPDSGILEKSLGSSKDIKVLNDLTKSNSGEVYYSHNMTFANVNIGGYDKNTDVVFDSSGNPIMDSLKTTFLLNFYKMSDKFIKYTLNSFKENNIDSITIEGIGKYAYDDNNPKNGLTKRQMILSFDRLMNKTDKKVKYAFNIGNSYTLPFADKIFNMVEKTSKYDIESSEIPFNQILIHGLIGYSLQTPGNMTQDLTDTKLKWAEFGATPYFLVTNDSTVKLNKTNVDNIYSSVFADWESDIIATAKEYADKMGSLHDKTIIDHTRNDNLAIVRYSDGSTVYVNYSNEDKKADGIVIAKKSYMVAGGAK